MYPYGYFYFDPTYILVLVGALICMSASAYVNSSMRKYHGIRNARGLSGGEAAGQILMQQGIYDVTVECMPKGSGDHYDPSKKVLRLSYENYSYTTITAVAVAAHECGHAIQHQKGYAPLKIRTAMVPVVNISSFVGLPLIILGVILSWNQTLIQIGIWAFALAVFFQLVTLPVEFDASRRGLQILGANGLLGSEEGKGAKKVLTAAAMTYVAAAASSILQLLRLILLFGGNKRRD